MITPKDVERFAKQAALLLTEALGRPIEGEDLEIPPDRQMGDFGFPCFRLAKEFRKAPPQIAKDLSSQIAALPSYTQEKLQVSAAGPYVNFTVPASQVFQKLLREILEGEGLGSYGKLPEKSRGTWVLEYSSLNVAKPFQIYHLRSTILGAAMDRIGRYRGVDTISINHLGDWGTQYGKLSIAFRLFGDTLPAQPTIMDLVDIYVKFHEAAEKDPSLEDQAREAFLKLEQGDPELTKLWQKCVDISLKEFDRIYEKLDVKFDYIWGESFYKDQLEPLLARLKKDQLLRQSEGAWVVDVSDRKGKEIPPCILQKKDGATIYATRDVAAALYRYDRFHFDRMIYFVGGEQKLHFEQVFGVLRRLGVEWESKCEHVPFGIYRFKDSKMSTRKGNFITFDSVVEQAKEKVISLMQSRDKISEGDIQGTAEKIAIGAILFSDLSVDPVRNVEFDLERVVDFDGETGPYLQYAHTRCLSILRKSGQSSVPFNESVLEHLQAPEEARLVKTLGQLPYHLERSLRFAKASQLANYLIDLTRDFGTFYRNCKVIQEDQPELTQARLMLVEATRRILARGLELMGIPLPHKM